MLNLLGGQKVAKRLQRQLKKTGREVRKVLEEYTDIPAVADGLPGHLTFEEATNLVSDSVSSSSISSPIPQSVLMKGNELLHVMKRCEEEKDLVMADVRCAFDHRQKQHASAVEYTARLGTSSKDTAIRAHLIIYALSLECILNNFFKAFGDCVDFQPVPDYFNQLIEVPNKSSLYNSIVQTSDEHDDSEEEFSSDDEDCYEEVLYQDELVQPS